MRNILTKYKRFTFPILILIGIIGTICFFIKNYESEEEFFNKAVSNSFKESYSGIVFEKYHDKYNHGLDVIVIGNNGTTTELYFVYEKPNPYEFIEIGDSLIKKKETNSIIIKRSELDTTIFLEFKNLKGAESCSEKNKFLNR